VAARKRLLDMTLANRGEPTKIAGGDYVVLGYETALRLTNEVYYSSGGVAQATNSYGYDASGSREPGSRDKAMVTV
jgi:hypothetical protein